MHKTPTIDGKYICTKRSLYFEPPSLVRKNLVFIIYMFSLFQDMYIHGGDVTMKLKWDKIVRLELGFGGRK